MGSPSVVTRRPSAALLTLIRSTPVSPVVRGQYGHVKIIVEPNESGRGYEFINKIVGGAIPKEYIEPVNQVSRALCSLVSSQATRLLTLKVTLYDGSYHEVDSSEMAFKIAGSMAFKEAMKADPVLMEPIMQVDVMVPEEYGRRYRRPESPSWSDPGYGAARRRGYLCRRSAERMFGYATALRSRTQGRG